MVLVSLNRYDRELFNKIELLASLDSVAQFASAMATFSLCSNVDLILARESDINLFILLIFVGVLLFYMFAMSIYKSRALLTFQGSFFLNLCFLSGYIIFSHTKSQVKSSMQTSGAVLSIGVAFVQFCGIIVHQIYSYSACKVRKSGNVQLLNEEQSQAILDISSRFKDQKYSAEKQPLMDQNHSDSDDSDQNQVASYGKN